MTFDTEPDSPVATPVALIPRKTRRADHGITESGPELIPLEGGQQYRFTFDMAVCVGCHSCEVACAEQNNLPTEVVWRRVGEIEGGSYPSTSILHLSMACNHCLEPTCLQGCPTGAYQKLDSGIVAHLADECIGCQYCTWTCPYSVPTYQPDRRVVSKCDLCKPRLEQGFTSACVEACPTRAIGIEAFDVEEWRADHEAANGPNLPSADISLSTTRLIVPDDVPADTTTAGDHALEPEHPHWPLVAVTLLTEVAVGLFVARWLDPDRSGDRLIPLLALATTGLGMNASLAHLGRPIMALKAFRRVHQSWLSREALAFAVLAGGCALATLLPSTPTAIAGGVVAIAAAYTSARLYMVPGRPSWNTQWTIAAFVASGLATGGAAYSVVFDAGAARAIAAVGLAAAVGAHAANLVRLRNRPGIEFAGTWTLSTGVLAPWVTVRFFAAGVGLVTLAAGWSWVALVAIVVGELVGRWLFYVSVVPLSIPGSFFRGRI